MGPLRFGSASEVYYHQVPMPMKRVGKCVVDMKILEFCCGS